MKIISLLKSIFHKNNHSHSDKYHDDKYYCVEGYGTTSDYPHAEGNYASGSYSHAEGHYSKN